MTYEEYKNSKRSNNKNKKSIIKSFINKILIVIILLLIVLISCNYSPKFKTFIEEEVLQNTIDFSKVNKLLSNITDVFKEEENIIAVSSEIKESEIHLDGIKYKINEGENIKIKDSGIITFIGEKEGYNNTIIVQQSNGYYAWYGNIKEEVKIYDYIESGSTLGTAISDEYYYVLLKDGKPVELNEN